MYDVLVSSYNNNNNNNNNNNLVSSMCRLENNSFDATRRAKRLTDKRLAGVHAQQQLYAFRTCQSRNHNEILVCVETNDVFVCCVCDFDTNTPSDVCACLLAKVSPAK
jgi:hypothetical protein